MVDGPYEDVLSEEELAIMNGGDGTVEAAPVDEPSGAEGEGEGVAQTPETDAGATPSPDVDPELADFLKQHAGKSPDELARIAFEQAKRANRLGFEQRQTTKQMADAREAAKALVEQARAAAEAKRAEFEQQLETDPDAATRRLHEQMVDSEVATAEARAEALEREAAVTEALDFAQRYIPNLPQRAPQLMEVGREVGFSDAEIGAVTDGRQLVTLHLARIGRDAIIAGLMGPDGMPKTGGAPAAPTDPRLRAPAAPTSAGSGTGAGSTARDPNKVLADTLMLSESDLAKLSMEDIARIAGA